MILFKARVLVGMDSMFLSIIKVNRTEKMASISMTTNVFNKREVVRTCPGTKNSPLKIDALTTILSLWGLAYFQV